MPSISASKHELFSILILAIGTLLVSGAFNMQSFVVESVLHSVSTRDPSFNAHSGYYGQSIMYGTYMFSNLMAPLVSYKIGSHWSLVVGTITFIIYLAGFFILNGAYYYVAQALAGAGFGLYYAGQGLYLVEHSNRKTITRNSSLVGSISNISITLAGLVLLGIFTMTPTDKNSHQISAFNASEISSKSLLLNSSENMLSTDDKVGKKEYRQYNSLVQSEKIETPTLNRQFKLIFDVICEPKVFILTSFFVAFGLQVSFWNSAFPTTFSFTKVLSSNPNLYGYYMIMVGLGSLFMGVFITICSKRWPLFGLAPTMIIQIVIALALYLLVWLSIPNLSTVRPNPYSSRLIEPSTPVCLIIGLLLGMSDASLNVMRIIVCTFVCPEKKLQTFSASKIYQSMGSCIAFFLSSSITIDTWVAMLGIAQILGCIGFLFVSKKIMKDHVKIHTVPTSTSNETQCETIEESS